MVTTKDIIRAYLKGHGYDGLCREKCGCGIDDFAPCISRHESGIPDDCMPAKRITVTECNREQYDFDPGMVGETVFVPSDEQ